MLESEKCLVLSYDRIAWYQVFHLQAIVFIYISEMIIVYYLTKVVKLLISEMVKKT